MQVLKKVAHTSTSAKTQKETKKLGYTEVTEYVLDSNIKTLKELQSIAIKHKNEGKNNLFSFLSQNSLDVSDLIDRTWDMNSALERQQRQFFNCGNFFYFFATFWSTSLILHSGNMPVLAWAKPR